MQFVDRSIRGASSHEILPQKRLLCVAAQETSTSAKQPRIGATERIDIGDYLTAVEKVHLQTICRTLLSSKARQLKIRPNQAEFVHLAAPEPVVEPPGIHLRHYLHSALGLSLSR